MAATASMVLATPASANWQYTRWEMTPAEVIAASNGAARNNGNRGFDAEGVKAKLIAPFTGESEAFTAVFLFDDEEKLKEVTLTPMRQESCPSIRDRLRSHYGQSAADTDMVHAGVTRWDDFDDKNLVVFLQLENDGCTIQYSKLHNTSPNGDDL